MLRRRFVIIIIWLLSLCIIPAYSLEGQDGNYAYNRARVLGYMLQRYLGGHSFNHQKINDTISKRAFGLYLKQLDPQKRFLLKKDVDELKAYADKIDDEMNSAKFELPEKAAGILAGRTVQVRQMVSELLSRNFDFSRDESLEVDADKLDYCASEGELKERWRKLLTYQVLTKYLGLVEDRDSRAAAGPGAEGQEKASAADLQKTAREKIMKNYEETFSRMQNEKETEKYDRYFIAVARAFDPHTNYMPPTNKEEFDISMRGSLEGIGARLREEDGYVKVESIMPGGPAARQGQLLSGDVILKVGEGGGEPVDIVDMRLQDAVRLIRGKKGSEVRLTIKRQSASQLTIPIVRDIIQIEDTFAKGATLRDEGSGKAVGYIRLPSFYRDFKGNKNGGETRSSTDDMKKELRRLDSENVSGLILDLRNNGGGALEDAVNIAGLFIKAGPIVQVKSGSGDIAILNDNDPSVYYKGPVVVLVNQFSASASEILAGALQDYGRAVIVGGRHTHGKGTVQMVIDLDAGIPPNIMDQYKPFGALLLTIQKFYRVSGESTQYRGVVPDIILPDPLGSLKTGEQYLEYALPWDTVKPAPYTKWQQPRTDLGLIKAKSSARVRASRDFEKINRESEELRERVTNTLQSLNIDAVRKEREESVRLFGKEGKVPYGHANQDGKSPSDAHLTEEDRKKLWTDEVRKDPYVREATAVLMDMIAAAPAHR